MSVQKGIVKAKIGGVIEVRNVFTANITPVAGDDTNALWFTYLDSVYDAVDNLVSNAYETYSFQVQMTDAGHWVPIHEGSFSHGGTIGLDSLPSLVAGVILGIAPGYRHVGKKFFGPIPESMATGSSLAAGAAAAAAAILLAYITPATSILGSTLDPGVVDKTGTFHAFTGGVVSSLLGTQRRRKPGIGI